jgi:hypothetical protein
MDKEDKVFAVAFVISLVACGIIVVGSQRVVDRIAFARLENPATYHLK